MSAADNSFTFKKFKMKYTITAFIVACAIFSCKENRMHNVESGNSRMQEKIDSFVNGPIAAFSITRLKKLVKRIEQIDTSEQLALDTLPDNRVIAYKKINGNREFYINDGNSIIRLYSEQVKESIRAEAVAIELFETERKRECARWTKNCNDPEFPLSPEDKLVCTLNINLYCK
jgi:hypothetical protein